MHRFIGTYLALCCVLVISWRAGQAQNLLGFPPGTFMGRAALDAGSAPPAVTWTPTANPAIQDLSFVSSATFTGASIGTAAGNRWVVVCVSIASGVSNNPASGVTVGGASLTLAKGNSWASDNGSSQSIWYGNITTGTTANIVVTATTAGSLTEAGIGVGALTTTTGAPNTTADLQYNVGSDPQVTTSALTIPSNGIGIVCGGSSQPAVTPTWNVGVQDYNVINGGSNWQMLLGHISATGSRTPSISGYNGNKFGMSAASWGP